MYVLTILMYQDMMISAQGSAVYILELKERVKTLMIIQHGK